MMNEHYSEMVLHLSLVCIKIKLKCMQKIDFIKWCLNVFIYNMNFVLFHKSIKKKDNIFQENNLALSETKLVTIELVSITHYCTVTTV